MGTREEVSLRNLKDSKDSEVQAGAELGELARRGRYQRRARPTCLDGEDGEGASYGAPRRGMRRCGARGTPRWGASGYGGIERSCADRESERGAHRYKSRVPIDRELAERLSR